MAPEKRLVPKNIGNHLLYIKYDSLSSEVTECADINELDYPFKSSASGVEVVGSCNGLICILINYSFLYIWNPATNEYKILPETPDMNYYWKETLGTYGFGYDCNTDDYKVVKFWVLFNGALHWLVARHDDEDSNLLISFEINSKKFNELQLPKERSEDYRYFFSALGVLEGCLCNCS
ncbi:F-box/kelch-repeat protein At3g06240-like [Papaver somniferum]|uniref:F-box/kelch-repeat protein At3g06240-like n=1 Tax=Papaver somniferum TaxID=3469 RepID=UPI000E6FA1AD|nr:F-box/kelch-repeat protein At3g06240-like [Papaver somniferum]